MLDKPKRIRYRRWDDDEVDELRRLILEGHRGPIIARRLNRTTRAIHRKISDLGMQKPQREKPRPLTTMSFRVTVEFEKRFRSFCRSRAANFSETLEVVMDSFMNQVHEDELNHKRRTNKNV